jgi:glycine betaine/proline transport system permease protein
LLAAVDLFFVSIAVKAVQDGSAVSSAPAAAALIAAHTAFGFFADRLYRAQYRRWRSGRNTPSGVSLLRAGAAAGGLGFIYALVLYRRVSGDESNTLFEFPELTGLANRTSGAINRGVSFLSSTFEVFFDAITASMRIALNFIENSFTDTPWPAVMAIIVFIAYRRGGLRNGILTLAAMTYLGIFGLWDKGMATLALVVTAVIICVLIGLPVGVLCAKSPRTNAVVGPVLDVMQTLPTFVYLIPAVAFFSIGKPPGLIATVIFALPPIIRLTSLGIVQVPSSVLEAADAFGATGLQRLLKVELPLAAPSIRLGVNQTIMMSLSMIVIAAMIGAGGLGEEVIHSLQYLQTGKGFIAGFAIVLVAMVLDRLVRRQGRQ